MFDLDHILSANPIESVVGRHIDLIQRGGHMKGLCCFHAEKTASLVVNVRNQRFKCMGCGAPNRPDGAWGNSIDFIQVYNGVGFIDACEILGGTKEAPGPKGRNQRTKKVIKSVYAGIEPLPVVPDHAELISVGKRTPEIWNPTRDEGGTWATSKYKPSMVFEYRNAESRLMGYVLRIDTDSGKVTPTVLWCKRSGTEDKEGWCHYTFKVPMPLYGLDELARNPDASVMIVEGEKVADAAHRTMSQYCVVTWPGGTQVPGKVDWSVLAGRNVVIWPDADEQGVKAAGEIADILVELGANVRVVEVMG